MELCGRHSRIAKTPHTRGEVSAGCGCSDSVFSLRRMTYFDAMALRRSVLHNGGIINVMASAPFVSHSALDPVSGSMTASVWFVGWCCEPSVLLSIVVMCSCLFVLKSQSNQPVNGSR
jgi:hypothetical protein